MASIILFLILSLIFRKNNQSLFFFFTDEAKDMNPDSDTILNIKYKISGDRNHGSHTPMFEDESSQMLTFKSALVLQRPVLEPCLAVGFLPLPPEGLRVGQLFTMKWRVERLKYLEDEQYVSF